MEENEVQMEIALDEIVHILARTNDEQLISDFFNCMFTKAELKDFASRWILVKELNSGTPQRKIAQMYGMSLCKITRGSKELKKDGSAFKLLLDRISCIESDDNEPDSAQAAFARA